MIISHKLVGAMMYTKSPPIAYIGQAETGRPVIVINHTTRIQVAELLLLNSFSSHMAQSLHIHGHND